MTSPATTKRARMTFPAMPSAMEVSEAPVIPELPHEIVRDILELRRETMRMEMEAMCQKNPEWGYDIGAFAASRGLKGPHAYGCRWGNSVLETAVERGDLETFKWALDYGYPKSCGDIPSKAAKLGHLEMFKWAVENGYRATDWTYALSALASGGHLETLKWARARGLPWGGNTCAEAARGGHLETLKWARENGCPWGYTFSVVAKEERMDILKWVVENGCPWDKYSLAFEVRLGRTKVLEWAVENGCPWDAKEIEADAEYERQRFIAYERKLRCGF